MDMKIFFTLLWISVIVTVYFLMRDAQPLAKSAASIAMFISTFAVTPALMKLAERMEREND
jgi:hypothetical protein